MDDADFCNCRILSDSAVWCVSWQEPDNMDILIWSGRFDLGFLEPASLSGRVSMNLLTYDLLW